MDLDTVADELYALPRGDFIEVRDERLRQARADGDRELATEIGRLRKPSTAAWLVNRLAREQPDEINALVELGDALRRAHSDLDGEALRRLSGQRHELVVALAGQARQVGRSAGHRVSETVSRELEDTFTAALGDPDVARVLAAGRLTSGRQPGASEGWGWPSGDAGEPGGQQHDGAQQRDDARQAASDAEASLRDAAASLSRAEHNEDEANQAVADRRAELQAAERAADEAANETAAARRNRDAAGRQAREAWEAQQRADDLDRRLG